MLLKRRHLKLRPGLCFARREEFARWVLACLRASFRLWLKTVAQLLRVPRPETGALARWG